MTNRGAWSITRRIAAMVLICGAFVAGLTEAQARSRRTQPIAEQTGPRIHIVSFGLYGAQSVFESEAKGAAQSLVSYFQTPVRPVVRYNSRRVSQALPSTLMQAMNDVRRSADPERDILVLFLTSHGTTGGLAAVSRAGSDTLSPPAVARMLAASGARYRIVIVSACYSGVFADRLSDPDTLVITAAASDRASFGCADRVRWTYFGEAFFRQSLRRGVPLTEAFARAKGIIRAREAAQGQTPSNPQFSGGATVLRMLGQ